MAEPPREDGLTVLVFRRMYDEHSSFLHNFVRRMVGSGVDPGDLVQEVFTTAWKRRDTFIPGSSPRPWLCGIAIRLSMAHRRKQKLRRFFGLEEAAEIADPRQPGGETDLADDRRRLARLLEKLPEKKRSVLVLYELQGFSGEEIAVMVGCPLKTVWTRLFHARKAFVELLEADKEGAGHE